MKIILKVWDDRLHLQPYSEARTVFEIIFLFLHGNIHSADRQNVRIWY